MILNPGFETRSPAIVQPGIPSDWDVTTTGTAEDSAQFTGDTGYAYGGYETFEHGWTVIDPQVLIAALTNVIKAYPEEFSFWAINQGVMQLSALEAASFTGQTIAVESFDAWDGPDVEFGTSTAFVETFAGWGTADFALTTLEHAKFDTSSVDVEQFVLRAPQQVSADIASNKLTRFDNADFVASINDLITLATKAGAVLPAPLSSSNSYRVASVSAASITLKATSDGAAIDLTDAGVGTSYVLADPGKFWPEEMG